MEQTQPTIEPFNIDDLVSRLEYHSEPDSEKIILLTGSGMSLRDATGGVSSTSEIVEEIRRELKVLKNEGANGNEKQTGGHYQSTFKKLIGRRGQSGANRFVQDQILKSTSLSEEERRGARTFSDDQLTELQRDFGKWKIPSGHKKFAEIATSKFSPFEKTVLTTNFDPLHEVAISSCEQQVFWTSLDKDGDATLSNGYGHQIIHLHGSWCGSDTLHTEIQLQKKRPQLEKSLSKLLSGKKILVLGYGGWDDVLMRTLCMLSNDGARGTEIMWCFFSESIEGEGELAVISKLQEGIENGGVQVYSGISASSLFDKYIDTALPKSALPIVPKTASLPLSNISFLDTPPSTEFWVGREKQLEVLTDDLSRIVFINGIGGQGKSALAARYFNQQNSKSFDYKLWFDLREQGDSLHTKMISAIQSSIVNASTQSAFSNASFSDICELFIEFVCKKRALLVFDNVDHYVDLDTLEPTGDLKFVLDRVEGSKYPCRVVLTCRPSISEYSPSHLTICLDEGLSLLESSELFKIRKAVPQKGTVEKVWEITKGHPLWLNLIAVQVSQGKFEISTLEQHSSEQGVDLSVRMLGPMWGKLNDEGKWLLRTICAANRPLGKESLYEIVHGAKKINWNRFGKALNALRKMHLVEARGKEPEVVLDAHPLVRRFVRNQYPPSAQQSFGLSIANCLKGLIGAQEKGASKAVASQMLHSRIVLVEIYNEYGYAMESIEQLCSLAQELEEQGQLEESIRLCKSVISGLDLAEAISKSTSTVSLIAVYIGSLSKAGRFEEAESQIESLEAAISGRDSRYILCCDLRSEMYRLMKNWSEAERWGKEGVDLLSASGADTKYSSKHNWALAARENGDPEKALPVFLDDATLEDFVSNFEQCSNAATFGNVGRVHQLLGKSDMAIWFYRKSLQLLLDDTKRDELNLGYAYFWISQTLFDLNKSGEAQFSLMLCRDSWSKSAPCMRKDIEDEERRQRGDSPAIVDLRISSAIFKKAKEWASQFQARTSKFPGV